MEWNGTWFLTGSVDSGRHNRVKQLLSSFILTSRHPLNKKKKKMQFKMQVTTLQVCLIHGYCVTCIVLYVKL